MRIAASALLGPLFLTCASPAQQGGLATELATVTQAPEYRHAHWGLLLVDAGTGAVLFEQDADKLFAPASTTKLFSCAAALEAFGADHRFTTVVVRQGEVDSAGVLRGDLVLVASGDPTLGGRTRPDKTLAYTSSDHIYSNGNERGKLTDTDPLAGLTALARQVASAGIRKITGDVRIDDRLFDADASTGSGPRKLTPIVVNDNLIDVIVTPGKAGEAASVTVRPASSTIFVDARVTTGQKDSKTTIELRSPTQGRFVVRGSLAEGHAPLVRTQEVDDPANFARALFLEALAREGVATEASAFDPNRRDALPTRETVLASPVVATFVSVPLAEHLKVVLKVSHNLHASLLPLLLAVKAEKRTLAEGLKEERRYLDALAVPTATISFGGGAGGSPADRTTPRATVALLLAIAKRPWGSEFRAMLPVLGVDGTLSLAVPSASPARGKAQAKTGTYFYDNPMNGTSLLTSKALAGWLETKSGRQLAFCFVVNGVHLAQESEADRIGQALGRLCEIAWDAL